MQDDLVQRAQAGDPEAFQVLAREAADRLYAVAWRILRDPDRAEDALQQALIRIWEDLPSLRDPARFEAWAYRIVVRASYREAARARRSPSPVRELRLAGVGLDGIDAILDRDEMDRSFRALTPEHRAVLVLRYFVGLPIADIAETLGIPNGTAASRLHYAIDSMRAAVEAEGRGVAVVGRPA